MKKLKYKKEIETLPCDASSFNEIEVEAFRWTFEEINDKRNFEPIYVNDPKRKQESCLGYALSFYETKKAGIKKHKELTLNKPNLYKKLGSHIAYGVLSKSDGIAGEPDEIQHFDFFTYETIQLSHKFSILEGIV